ncbi:NitT/TauT family transport system substrate-binding protein [Oceanotoga teriensis]|uniref:NitT/TauT family transport system substrate-binding protein n=1 Tax=Oceanotoga teriensis TaxID=515440 RepID=A0AA45C4F3_9BACT|nr:MqnA/MqnD/SBP family protein [Oceanotoga teriensis]PWJ85143.1 NitT/TauT family transport system substrate-binding protein [Oceanotoga teriensis]
MKNRYLSFFLIFLLSSFVFGVKVSVPVGPASLPVFYLQENSNGAVEASIHKDRNIVISKLMQNEVDIALLPTNEAIKLYNKGVDIKILNIHTWGVFYLLTTNSEINSWSDLSGKEVYVPDKGGPMDILFSFVTDFYDVNNIKIKRGKPNQIAQLMINDMADTAFLREPFVTSILLKNKKAIICEDVQKDWYEISGIELPQASLVVRTAFLRDNKELVEDFNKDYSKAIDWVNSNIDEASKLGMKYMNISDKVTKASVERLNLRFKDAHDAKDEIEKYLKVLYDFNKESIGGKMPDDEFYY